MNLYFLLSNVALAGPVEHVGFGASSMGRGSGGLGLVDDVTGVFLNPAGLVRLDGPQVSVGYGLYRMRFDEIPDVAWDTNRDGLVDEHDDPLEISTSYGRADGFSFAIGRSIGERFGLSVAGFLPRDRVIRIRSVEPSLPTWVMYENRPHRFEFIGGFGWEQLPGVYIGGAVEVLAQARYSLSATVDGGLHFPRDGEGMDTLVQQLQMDIHEMNLEMKSSFAPTAAVFWDVGQTFPGLDGWNLAGTYRGASGIPVDMDVDIQANITIEETEELEAMTFAALLPMELSFLDHYVPSRLAGGLAFEHAERGRVYLDVVRTRWSEASVNFTELRMAALYAPMIGLEQTIEDKNQALVVLKDTVGTRLGGELVLPSWTGPGKFGRVDAVVRAGGGYEPSALEGQGTDTRILDSDRVWFSCGGGVQHHDPLGLVAGPLAWNAYLEYHMFAPGALSASESADPVGLPIDGSDIPIGGHLLAAGLEWSFEY